MPTQNSAVPSLKSIIGDRLAHLRHERRLSQVKAAKWMGWSRLKLSHVETGKMEIDALELLFLSSFFRVPINYFLGLQPKAKWSAQTKRKDWGKRLKKLRRQLNLSQDKMAQWSGCSRIKWLRVEQGKTDLTATETQRLARQLKISVDELFLLEPQWLGTPAKPHGQQ